MAQPPCTRQRELLQQQPPCKDANSQGCTSNNNIDSHTVGKSVTRKTKGSAVGGKPFVRDLNKHILCRLCFGYLIDATTLVECMHSYCRSCIIYRMKNGPKTCPACDTIVTSRPRPDVALQRLIYLAVPGLYKSELERRRNFHLPIPNFQNPGTGQLPQGAPELSYDDLVSLSLCRLDLPAATRYLKCPAGVTVRHLQRLLMLKQGWQDEGGGGGPRQTGNAKIEIMHELEEIGADSEFEILEPSWTLMDLACIFKWSKEAPMRLFYRIAPLDEPTIDGQLISASTTISDDGNVDATNSAIENIQRPPTPPPSPKPRDPPEKSPRPVVLLPAPTTPTPTIPTPAVPSTVPYSSSKDRETKKTPRWVVPATRSLDSPLVVESRSRSGKLHRLEHHKRKKRRNKRIIAEITRPPQEDLLKLKVRLTPCPPRISSTSSQKDKLSQMRAVRKEKTKDEPETVEPPKPRPPEKPSPKLEEAYKVPEKRRKEEAEVEVKVKKEEKPVVVAAASKPSSTEKKTPQPEIVPETKTTVAKPPPSRPPAPPPPPPPPVKKEPEEEIKRPERAETPRNEEVLRKLGLVAVSEANRTRQERAKSPSQAKSEKSDPAVEREKLEKQLKESKANRVRSLLAEKQMRDTLKSIMSKETSSSSAPPPLTRSATPTVGASKRKDVPPLTPLRGPKRPTVTFAPAAFTINNKYESPLDLSSQCKGGILDLSPGLSDELTIRRCGPDEKPVSILRIGGGTSGGCGGSRQVAVKPREELVVKKIQESNLRTLSDTAVSLLGGGSSPDKARQAATQSFLSPIGAVGLAGAAGKVALKIPQPHQRITGFGIKIKPNVGVRHIPNPQAIATSQYRNQRTGYYSLAHQPP
ncbi:polycomb group protein Psc-like [Copidosoma floridanum]|uniref:polycomb group protein Psc-like n=1 Tax=Copidosoma floridanum TaxID=29053 RepID=UPI0006C9D678|nr:polycomb group protein Psc-like [Copidosoma floridanum]XP_014211166.1 polycomb group protein Psc-like [Copidosoma floridanum]XP_014211167.1 polycomb group protein Psc-like [Copidosoma floridanum]